MNAPIRHAWLFQYKDREPGSGRHDQDNDQRTPTDWPVQRWAADMQVGDLVFLWQTTEKGGLRGWGEIARIDVPKEPVAGRTVTRVVVDEQVWLGRPILRSEVIKSGALRGHLLLRAPQGTTFRLAPDEARDLAELLPQDRQPSLEGLAAHPTNMKGEDSSWLTDLLVRLGVSSATPLAEQVLQLAAQPQVGAPRRISTTRLLLALHSLAQGPVDALRSELGVQSFARLLRSDPALDKALSRLREAYLAEPEKKERPATSVGATDNAWALLGQAVEIGKAVLGSDGLSADAVLAALLRTERGRLLTHLQQFGLDLARLRALLSYQLQQNSPREHQIWRSVLGDGLDVAQAVSSAAAPAPSPPSPLRIGVAGHGNDDPSAADLDDALGAQNEAEAFARLIASRSLRPPLAVGVFGDWGSGKSFFLRLVHQHVAALAGGQAPEADDRVFHQGVVQIRFNAWHYADTNLWASLVDHIFVELDQWARRRDQGKGAERLFDQLATARELTLEAAEQLVRRRREQRQAAQLLGQAEQALTQARSGAGGSLETYWEAVKTTFSGALTPDDKERLASATKALGLGQAALDAQALSEALQALGEQGNRGRVLSSAVLNQAGARWVPVAFVAGCLLVPAALIALREGLAWLTGQDWVRDINALVLSASGAAAALVGTLGMVTRRVRGAIDQLEGFRGQLDAAVRRQTESPAQDVKKAQETLAQRRAEVEEAKVQLSGSSERLAEAEREYASGTGRGRLMRFVRERAVNGDYAKHQGLVATVRKDFEQLAANLGAVESDQARDEAQREAFRQRIEALKALAQGAVRGDAAGPEAGASPEPMLSADEIAKLDRSLDHADDVEAPAFDRIVLYIDDLDRCAPAKVVDVLQAVHLLLGFPLFVVLVAVDVRWVSRALERHYAAMLSPQHKDSFTAKAATAHDYLEKIFQIPYWVRPMTRDASAEFLRSRSEPPPGGGELVFPAMALPPEAHTGLEAAPLPRPSPVAPVPVAAEHGPADVSPAPVPVDQEQVVAAPAPAPRTPVFSLNFSVEERDFMTKLAPFVGASPRRALRFLNVYRVMKSSLGAEELSLLAEQGSHLALMTQVAVITGAPRLLQHWLTALREADDGAGLNGLRQRLGQQPWPDTAGEAGNLLGALEALATEPERSDQPALSALRRHAELAKRYSFTN